MDLWTSPAASAVAVTPSNSVNFATACRGLFVGSGGDIVAVFRTGAAITFANVPSGSVLPLQAVRVNSTGTTASDIVALY